MEGKLAENNYLCYPSSNLNIYNMAIQIIMITSLAAALILLIGHKM